ncbi:MAG TPA: hypothetical protein VF498_12415, partial [Anaerolineales bacterium]
DPRLRSRMEDTRLCTIFGITVPSFRGSARESRARGKTRQHEAPLNTHKSGRPKTRPLLVY